MIKNFLIDLDGTLLTKPHLDIKEKNLDAIRRIVTEGHRLGICTGRSVSEIKYLEEKYDFRCDYYVGLNGMISSEECIPYFKELRDLAKYLWRHHINYELQDNVNRYFSHPEGPEIIKTSLGTKQIIIQTEEEIENITAYKIVVRQWDNKLQMNEIKDRIQKQFPGMFNVIVVENRVLEVIKINTDKVTAMRNLFNNDDYIIAIGDSENDKLVLLESNRGYLIKSKNSELIESLINTNVKIVDELYEAIDKELIA